MKPLRILILDDDAFDRMALERSFSKAGIPFDSVHAQNTQEAETALQDQKFRLVFMDIRLPGLDGVSYLRDLRKRGYSRPILVMTSKGDEQIAVSAMQAGASDYISKDFLGPDVLRQLVFRALRADRENRNRKKAQKALRQSEARLVEAQRIAQIGFWEFEVASNRIFWSAELKKIFGVDPLLFEPTFEFYSAHLVPEDRAKIRNEFERALHKGESFQMDSRLIRSDGEIRYVDFQGRAVRNRSGRIVKLQGTVQDITDRKLAENALKDSELRFKVLAKKAPVGIFQSDTEGNCTYVNEKWVELSGIPFEKALGEGWTHALVPEDRDRLVLNWHENFSAGNNVNLEYRFKNVRTGEIRWVIGLAQRLVSADGEYVGYIGTVTDITPLKRVEEQLRLAEAKSSGLVAAIPDLLFQLDTEGLIKDYQASNQEDLAMPPAFFLGKRIQDIMGPPISDLILGGLEEAKVWGKSKPIEYQIPTLDGDVKYFEARISRTPVDDFLILVRNISQRKEAEIALDEANKELAASAKHAQELADLALAASKAKSEFLANMSHELRTPLNALLGFTRFLEETPLSAEQRGYLDAMRSSSEVLLGTIGDILDFSKIEAGRMELAKVPVQLSDLAKTVSRIFQASALVQGIFYVQKFDFQEDWVLGDSVRISQILINLLGNAFKFTQKGTVEVKGFSRINEEGLVEIEFRVRDTGIGIPKEKQSVIFESFTQATASTTRRFGGTGLGLSISQKLVEMMGGSIWVQSEEGKGSEFGFQIICPKSLPLHPQSADPKAAGAIPGQLRVLLVEDNRLNQVMATKIMNLQNWTVVVAGDGKAALSALGQDDFDVVVMDVQMPEMDGVEATSRIRKGEVPGMENIPVLGLTAHALPEEIAWCKACGMNRVLGKPYSPHQLIEAVTELVSDSETKIFDLSLLNDMVQGDLDFQKELVDLFLKEGPRAIGEMQEAVKNQNGEKLFASAHRIKPSLILFGFPEAEKVCEELLGRAKLGGDWEMQQARVGKLVSAMAEFERQWVQKNT